MSHAFKSEMPRQVICIYLSAKTLYHTIKLIKCSFYIIFMSYIASYLWPRLYFKRQNHSFCHFLHHVYPVRVCLDKAKVQMRCSQQCWGKLLLHYNI